VRGCVRSDGCVDMVVMRDNSRWEVLNVFLNVDSGGHVEHKACEYFKARAFRLEPHAAASSKKGSYFACDGEMLARGPGATAGATAKKMPLAYAPVDVTVRQGMGRVFCSHRVGHSHQLGAFAV